MGVCGVAGIFWSVNVWLSFLYWCDLWHKCDCGGLNAKEKLSLMESSF